MEKSLWTYDSRISACWHTKKKKKNSQIFFSALLTFWPNFWFILGFSYSFNMSQHVTCFFFCFFLCFSVHPSIHSHSLTISDAVWSSMKQINEGMRSLHHKQQHEKSADGSRALILSNFSTKCKTLKNSDVNLVISNG